MARRDTVIDLRQSPNGKVDKWNEGLRELHSKGKCSWSDAGAEDLKAAIVAATEDGAALLFSRTIDGGALSLQILSGAGRNKLYPASVAEINEALALVVDIAAP